ncbi:hypothetical protein GGX14DRAFT_427471 [Mycena pura]|uniref:Tautomerase cis-CaaD-like domain-containing protein n=1 Tax=Mycena pura TaxID=153505 RepID=A0AAD6YMG7_9AGAR|nr:hypothetical protein GGX14DRAFT_427471 [Mycena pura]
MPMYEVEHVTPLEPAQKDALAQAITNIHSTKFITPRLFVNVKFTDVSRQDAYVAGKRNHSNRVTGHVRRGPTRTRTEFDALCDDIHLAWASIVHPTHSTKPPADLELRAVFIVGEIITASEAGFAVPTAGSDQAWVKQNLAAFKAKAREGDQDFVDLLAELESRPEFKGISQ